MGGSHLYRPRSPQNPERISQSLFSSSPSKVSTAIVLLAKSIIKRKLLYREIQEFLEIPGIFWVFSAPGGIRTHNLLLRRQVLCPLSYGG